MINLNYLFFLAIYVLNFYIFQNKLNKNNKAHWVENSGFFIDTNAEDILIDAILNSDHYNAKGVLTHLKNNSKAHLIITPEGFNSLKSLGLEKSIDSRIFTSLPSYDETEFIEFGQFKINILQFEHTGVLNNGFALQGKDVSVFYSNRSNKNKNKNDDISSKYNSPDIFIANKLPLVNKNYIDSIKDRYNPSWLFMIHHNSGNDGIIINNGSVKKRRK